MPAGGIPHDLEHFIVEQALRCDSGFWGRVSRGAESGNFRITRTTPRRRPRSWHQELTKGYTGWDEDLVAKVVTMYREVPPAAFPIGAALTRRWETRRAALGT